MLIQKTGDPFDNVVFVQDIGERDTADLIESEFKLLNVAYRREMQPDWRGRPVANFYCTQSGGEMVSKSLEEKGVPHEWGIETEVSEDTEGDADESRHSERVCQP